MGRPRSEAAHSKVLQAAAELIAERGVDATSMDAVAERSGVSKATIYKHWKDKPALLLDVIADLHGMHNRPVFDSGDVKADLKAVLCYRPPHWDLRERVMPHFIAYSAKHHEFGAVWRKQGMERPQAELRNLIEIGQQKGELRTGLDLDLCISMLLGPLLYLRVFMGNQDEQIRLKAEPLVEAFWRAFAS